MGTAAAVTRLAFFALAVRLMINAGVGVAPWDVLHIGLTWHLPLLVGQVSILAGGLVVAFTWGVLREKPGIATLLNVLEIGLLLDVLGGVVPHPTQ